MKAVLMHVLPQGYHRIRRYGLFANDNRRANIAQAWELLAMPPRAFEPRDGQYLPCR